MVASQPNETEIAATVLSVAPAEDGWGAWAEMRMDRSRGAGSAEWTEGAEVLRVFVPPPLVEEVRERLDAGTPFLGRMTEGGPEPTYSLVPPPAAAPLRPR